MLFGSRVKRFECAQIYFNATHPPISFGNSVRKFFAMLSRLRAVMIVGTVRKRVYSKMLGTIHWRV